MLKPVVEVIPCCRDEGVLADEEGVLFLQGGLCVVRHDDFERSGMKSTKSRNANGSPHHEDKTRHEEEQTHPMQIHKNGQISKRSMSSESMDVNKEKTILYLLLFRSCWQCLLIRVL